MSSIYLSHNNIVSSLGFDSSTVVDQISEEVSGLRLVDRPSMLNRPFYSSLIPEDRLNKSFNRLDVSSSFTRLEKMLIVSLEKTLKASELKLTDRVGLMVSTTKGNIDVLEDDSNFPEERAYLGALGEKIQKYFGFITEPIVLSNACVSGILAIAVAKRLIDQGKFDHIFVVAGDLVTQFIISGFNSFQALSDEPCRPYCKSRSGHQHRRSGRQRFSYQG